MAAGLALVTALAAAAQEAPASRPADAPDLTELSLEELMNVNVEATSVARKPQRVSKSAAAVYVITSEEIRRSGLTTIPEILRHVPGLEVARVSSNTWAITSRGFNSQFSNKLLVLVDGRTVYTPLFSGVYWDVQDLLLEDVERIEVIRGPGGTLWGANAVNGVINIITRPAHETLGGLGSAGAGTEERWHAGARFGLKLGRSTALRAWSQWADHEGQYDAADTGIEDDWNQGRAGFRADGAITDASSFTLQGDAYRGGFDGPAVVRSITAPFQSIVKVDGFVSGGNVLGRFNHVFSADADLSLQAYVDSYRRDSADIFQRVDTADVDFENRFRLSPGNEITWGLGYRRFKTVLRGTFDVMLTDDHRTDDLWSAFVQDEITIVPERLALTLGSKFELNDFTGYEYLPSARVAFTPDERQTLWASVSRAVRTPAVAEDAGIISFGVIPGAPPTVVQVQGNEELQSERVIAYEAGWRTQPWDQVSFDLAAFLNDYSRLSSVEPGAPFFSGGAIVAPLVFGNGLYGRTWGAEVASQWNATPDWSLRAGYAFLAASIRRAPGSSDPLNEDSIEGSFPTHQAQLRSFWRPAETLELDASLYYVDRLPAQDADQYLRGDLRIGWRPTRRSELSLLVHGLLHQREREFESTFLIIGSEPEAGVLLRFTRRF